MRDAPHDFRSVCAGTARATVLLALRTAVAASNPAGIAAAPCTDGLAVCVSVPASAVTTEPVRIDVVIEDEDGDVDAAAAGFDVFVPTELTIAPCVREVPVRPNDGSDYPARSVDINDCVAGAGARGVRFFDAAGAEIAGGRLAYVPPAGRMSIFVSAPPESMRRPVSPDSELISFRAAYADGGPEPARDGTIDIRFVGADDADWSDAARPGDAVSFARAYAAIALPTACGGCHGRPDSPIGFLGVDARDGYTRMRCGFDGLDPLATPYVLYRQPRGKRTESSSRGASSTTAAARSISRVTRSSARTCFPVSCNGYNRGHTTPSTQTCRVAHEADASDERTMPTRRLDAVHRASSPADRRPRSPARLRCSDRT